MNLSLLYNVTFLLNIEMHEFLRAPLVTFAYFGYISHGLRGDITLHFIIAVLFGLWIISWSVSKGISRSVKLCQRNILRLEFERDFLNSKISETENEVTAIQQ